MKAVVLVRSLDVGGAERQATLLASALRRRGIDAVLVTFYDGGGLVGAAAALEVPVLSAAKRKRWDLVFPARLVALLRKKRPDVVFAFMDGPNLAATAAGPLIGRPRIVWGIRGVELENELDWLPRTLARVEARLARWARAIVVNSDDAAAAVIARGMPAQLVRVVRNGVDLDVFRFDAAGRDRLRAEWKVPDEAPLIGRIGRLTAIKDHPTFLRAAAAVRATGCDARFVCAGDGAPSRRRELEALAASLGLAEQVFWSPARSDMAAVYSACDAVVSTSTSEAFPNVLVEALACGTPCVSTDVGQSASIIGRFGVVVPVGDSAAVAKGCLEAVEMAGRGDDRGAWRADARDHVASAFGPDALAEGMLDAAGLRR